MMARSLATFVGAIGLVFSGASIVFWILMTGGAMVAFFAARKENANVQKRNTEGRAELWKPYADQIAELEKQIQKERKLINSR
jgi:hypothetical protein